MQKLKVIFCLSLGLSLPAWAGGYSIDGIGINFEALINSASTNLDTLAATQSTACVMTRSSDLSKGTKRELWIGRPDGFDPKIKVSEVQFDDGTRRSIIPVKYTFVRTVGAAENEYSLSFLARDKDGGWEFQTRTLRVDSKMAHENAPNVRWYPPSGKAVSVSAIETPDVVQFLSGEEDAKSDPRMELCHIADLGSKNSDYKHLLASAHTSPPHNGIGEDVTKLSPVANK